MLALLDRTVFPKSSSKRLGKGKKEIITLGKVQRCFTDYIGNSRDTERNPDLWREINDFANELEINHWTTCTINKNVQSEPHTDRKNIGLTTIIALGDYKGGELVVEDREIDIKEKPYQFNGYLKRHWTKPFTGTRYSLMFFNNRCGDLINCDPSESGIVREVIQRGVYIKPKYNFYVDQGEKWLDLGAHIGSFSKFCLINGAIPTAYEIHPDNYEKLIENLPYINAENMGVTATGGDRDILEGNKSYFHKLSNCPMPYDKPVHHIPTISFDRVNRGFNGCKMDIEGSELEIIDFSKNFSNLDKLVIAYHTKVDPEISNFRRRIERLKCFFTNVEHQKLPKGDKFNFWPDEIFIYCWNNPK